MQRSKSAVCKNDKKKKQLDRYDFFFNPHHFISRIWFIYLRVILIDNAMRKFAAAAGFCSVHWWTNKRAGEKKKVRHRKNLIQTISK